MYSTIKFLITAAATLLTMLFSARSFSQTSKFSLSVNSLTTNYNYGKSNKELAPYKKNFRGLQAGFSWQAGITPAFSVVPEIYFSMKGGRLDVNNPVTVSKSTVRTYSLELPVLARLHYNNLYLNAGPYAGYNMGGRIKIDGSGSIPGSESKITFGNGLNDFKRWDFGWQAGAGYNFILKRKLLTLDARYGYGLTNLTKNTERHNRALNISLVMSKQNKKKQPATKD